MIELSFNVLHIFFHDDAHLFGICSIYGYFSAVSMMFAFCIDTTIDVLLFIPLINTKVQAVYNLKYGA